MKIFNFKHIYLFFFCLLLTAFCENHSELNSNQEDNISYLKKINEITEFHSNDGINFFLYIDSLCCDEDNNLYVADSGWNKIFKFNADGQYLVSFGREGQGPGEFLARPGRYPLKISVGNDSNIYITDSKSERLSIFTDVGSYIKYFYLPPGLYGSAQINLNNS